MKITYILMISGILVAACNAGNSAYRSSRYHNTGVMSVEDRELVEAINEEVHHMLVQLLRELDYRVDKHLKRDQAESKRNFDDIVSLLRGHNASLQEVLHTCSGKTETHSKPDDCANCDDKKTESTPTGKKIYPMSGSIPSFPWK